MWGPKVRATESVSIYLGTETFGHVDVYKQK